MDPPGTSSKTTRSKGSKDERGQVVEEEALQSCNSAQPRLISPECRRKIVVFHLLSRA